jgi:hypothetical protein
LTVKFASEVTAYPTPWDWIKARIQSANYEGVHVGDYIPLTLSDGKVFLMEIAGVDTYYNYGATAVGHHIDFISRDCHPDTHVWNQFNYNNGISANQVPFLASDLNAWLNSLQTTVPGSTAAEGTPLVNVDYRTTGVFDKIPTALQALIVPKHFLHPRRYSAGVLLTDDNTYLWTDYGKLWLPTEWEIAGACHWATQGFGTFGSQQYPIFANGMKRIKGAGNGGARSRWWTASPGTGGSTYACSVSHGGDCGNHVTTYATLRAPLCFRIA